MVDVRIKLWMIHSNHAQRNLRQQLIASNGSELIEGIPRSEWQEKIATTVALKPPNLAAALLALK